MIRHVRLPLALVVALWMTLQLTSEPSHAQDSESLTLAESILKQSGISGGLMLHVGAADEQLALGIADQAAFQIQCLMPSERQVEAARQRLRDREQYGNISVIPLDSNRLPYIDKLANLIVVEQPELISVDEAMRVLVPLGVALFREGNSWKQFNKPWPGALDQWTHYLHDATGNAVAHDEEVGPPRRLQWVGNPRWSRHHDRMASMSAMVTAGGRLIYIMDEGSRVSIQLPSKWQLIARDAFNGTILWKHPIPDWQSHLWPLKSGPTQLARRLVATERHVFMPLGFEAPVSILDAVTGKLLKTVEGTRSTEEILNVGDKLILLTNSQTSQLTSYVPQFNVGDQRRVATEFTWDKKPRAVKVVDVPSGEILWSHDSVVTPLTLAATETHVYFHDGDKLVALDLSSGEQAWQSPTADRRAVLPMNFGPRLVVYQNVVLFAGGDRLVRAFDGKTGKQLWTAPHARGGYQSPEDLLVSGGLVWSAPTTRTADTGVFTGRDPLTGEVKAEIPCNVETYWFHHRCYIAKATDNFIMPSRTGVEFVDLKNQDWDIHHWVRGGCLYGVMPSNGLLYTPPHNCNCYPEAKIYGLNALASGTPTRPSTPTGMRRIEGPAFGVDISTSPATDQWPTFRHDPQRSGKASTTLGTQLQQKWTTRISGRLSSMVAAEGLVLVAQIDQHTVHALDAKTGETRWTYTTGGRVDSPPTLIEGRAVFGSRDGWVYCLRLQDGELIWKFRVAPDDQRLVAFEQIESVWPVHGSLLVHQGIVYALAGRSNFLDGGLTFALLDLKTGKLISESVIDETDPESGGNIQDRIQVLNMPVGLPDILSSDGEFLYMRSQKFDLDGQRLEIGPHSGVPGQQGSVQAGPQRHLFAPNGFLDESWFHRAYWVYGRSFAGGHAGYFQAAKYTAAGRILTFDDQSVYGYGRKPEYLKWTTVLEHQLFRTSEQPPETPAPNRQATAAAQMVTFQNSRSLDPTGQPVLIEAWVRAERPNGVIVARGGPAEGFALAIKNGRPQFHLRADSKLVTLEAKDSIVGRWSHVVGRLAEDRSMTLFVNGQPVASGKTEKLITSDPKQTMEIGADDKGGVGDYRSPYAFTGLIDEVRLYYSFMSDSDIQKRYESEGRISPDGARLVLACSFSQGDGRDHSGLGNNGTVLGATRDTGKLGGALRFRAQGVARNNTFVKFDWTADIPLFARAMVLSDQYLFVAGPPDLIDEEQTFQRVMSRDQKVQAELAQQDLALRGDQGALLHIYSKSDGQHIGTVTLESIPAWDAMIAAQGHLYLANERGDVLCFSTLDTKASRP